MAILILTRGLIMDPTDRMAATIFSSGAATRVDTTAATTSTGTALRTAADLMDRPMAAQVQAIQTCLTAAEGVVGAGIVGAGKATTIKHNLERARE